MQITVAKDMMSAAVKLAVEIEESSSIVTGCGVVSQPMASFRNEMRRAVLSFNLSVNCMRDAS